MPEAGIEISLDRDASAGPLATHMSRYSSEQYNSHVVHRGSDSARRDIVFENEAVVEFVREAFAGTDAKIQRKIEDVYPVVRRMGGEADVRAAYPKHGEQHLSGAEFAELARIIVTHSAIPAGAATVAVALIKATKDVVVKWLDGQGKKHVKIAVGPGKSIEVTGPIDDAKVARLTEFLEEALHSTAVKKPDTKPKA